MAVGEPKGAPHMSENDSDRALREAFDLLMEEAPQLADNRRIIALVALGILRGEQQGIREAREVMGL